MKVENSAQTPELRDLAIGIILGIIQTLYHLCYQKAAKLEKKATNLALILNMRDVLVYFYDVFLLGNPLVLTNLSGALLVTLASVAIMLLKPKSGE